MKVLVVDEYGLAKVIDYDKMQSYVGRPYNVFRFKAGFYGFSERFEELQANGKWKIVPEEKH